MANIGEFEKQAGITDRASFWAPYAKIVGTYEKDGKLRSLGFEAGVAELRRIAKARS